MRVQHTTGTLGQACPRCGSHSLIRNHATLACLPCGHIVDEPAREAWDHVWLIPGAGRRKLAAADAAELAGVSAPMPVAATGTRSESEG